GFHEAVLGEVVVPTASSRKGRMSVCGLPVERCAAKYPSKILPPPAPPCPNQPNGSPRLRPSRRRNLAFRGRALALRPPPHPARGGDRGAAPAQGGARPLSRRGRSRLAGGDVSRRRRGRG